MPRTSRRNLLTLFRAIGVDDAARGPEVSDNIQLVYVADSLRQTSAIDAGSGGVEPAVVGEHGIITLEVANVDHVEVYQITMDIAVPVEGRYMQIWTSGIQPVGITTPITMVTPLRTTGLQDLPAQPLCFATRGTLASASIPQDAFRMTSTSAFTEPFLINARQHFNVAHSTANIAVTLGIRWRELRLYPS